MKTISTIAPGSINHEDLVCLFQYICYGEYISWMDQQVKTEEPLHFTPKGDCFEDKLAEVLLQGGTLKFKVSDPEEDEECEYSKVVFISLADIYKGLEKFSEVCNWSFQDLVNENADGVTYWNALQCIIYGEIIYG